jgi:cardiolipin synthase (CMP-forming)
VADRPVERARLTFRRLSGLDRSGPPPPETLAGAPLNPWTLPNAIGFVRLALIPTFLVLAFSSDDGTDALPAIIFGVVGWGDYADGIAARVTGQYSRLGALLDPVIDRLLVVSGVVVCWHFDLLPRWALAVLVVRELAMVVLARVGLRRGMELRINWPGRLAVWPIMSAIFFALLDLRTLGAVLLYIGLGLALMATAMYLRDGLDEMRRKTAPTPSS